MRLQQTDCNREVGVYEVQLQLEGKYLPTRVLSAGSAPGSRQDAILALGSTGGLASRSGSTVHLPYGPTTPTRRPPSRLKVVAAGRHPIQQHAAISAPIILCMERNSYQRLQSATSNMFRRRTTPSSQDCSNFDCEMIPGTLVSDACATRSSLSPQQFISILVSVSGRSAETSRYLLWQIAQP